MRALLPLAALLLASCTADTPGGSWQDEYYRSESGGIVPRGFPGPDDDE
jgi:hypothetical protein